MTQISVETGREQLAVPWAGVRSDAGHRERDGMSLYRGYSADSYAVRPIPTRVRNAVSSLPRPQLHSLPTSDKGNDRWSTTR